MTRLDDRGAAIVWGLTLTFILTTAGLVAASVAQFAIVRQRVQTAADLSALAGAQAGTDPCAAAERAAATNGTTMLACALDGIDVVVRVSRPAPELVRRVFALAGQRPRDIVVAARAGPPGPVDDVSGGDNGLPDG